MLRERGLQRAAEVVHREAVEPLDGDVEVALLGIPVVQQLVGAAVDVAVRQHDVVVADEVRQRRVDRGHAGVEVPGEVFARERAGLEVDDVIGEADRGRVQQARVDLVQRLAALEGVLDPLGAGVQVRRGARDDRRGAEDRRDVVEDRVGALDRRLRRIVQQRLVRLAQRVLQRVEDLGELEAEEPLGVEARHAVARVEIREFAQGHFPQLVRRGVAGVQVGGEVGHAAAEFGLRVDREVPQLLVDEFGDGRGARGVAARAQFAHAREIQRRFFHRRMVPQPASAQNVAANCSQILVVSVANSSAW